MNCIEELDKDQGGLYNAVSHPQRQLNIAVTTQRSASFRVITSIIFAALAQEGKYLPIVTEFC